MTFYELIRASLLKDAELHPHALKGGAHDPPPENDKRRDETDRQKDS
jgi:hypothetical protein